jgi:electron transport complex protein RnfC
MTGGLASLFSGKMTFRRGIHPPHGKEYAEDNAIEVLPTPATVQIALLQHLGAPCQPTVKPKAEVQCGDVVGDVDAFVSAPVHASINGVAAKPTVATLPNGRHVSVVPIKASEEQPWDASTLYDDVLGGEWNYDAVDDVPAEEIADIAKNAGLVGMGGAAFPTHVKLRRNDDKPIDTLLLNGCECEPYLTADYRLMVEAPRAVVAGALLAQKATGARRVVIGCEDDTPRAVAALDQAAAGTGIEVQPLQTKYPQGGEKQLVFAVLGKPVPTGGLPLDVGVVVMNVGTSAALARAALRGKPMTHRVICVTGGGIVEPKNVLAPVGASYQDLVDFCGGLKDDAARIIAGGPMMGFTLGSLDTPITKGAGGLTVLSAAEAARSAETACVRCGRCVDVCPLNLVPTRIALASRAGNYDLAEQSHAMACMECGCCAYECPASIPLVQLIRVGKAQIATKKKAKK